MSISAPRGQERSDRGISIVLAGGGTAGHVEPAMAVADALVGLDRLAVDLGDVVESIDVNPFVALPKGQGGLALDALVVLRRRVPRP